MESQEVEGSILSPWFSKQDSNDSLTNSSVDSSSLNMSEASGSSSSPSQGRQGPSATKRTISESSGVRQMGPSPVKRQYQASNIQSPDDMQLKELDRLEKKEASLVNQLLHQLQMLHKRCNDERHQIVEEQRLLAERLEQIDANERTEEQAVREKNNRKLEEVRILLSQLRQKMSLEGSTSNNNSGMNSSVSLSLPSTSIRCDFSNALDIRRRLGSLDQQRQALLEQLYAATGSLTQGGSHVMGVQLHNCAPGREVAGSSTLTERVLPSSQQSEIAASSPESSEQAQSRGEEDSEISSSSDVLIPQNVEFVTEHGSASGSRASVINHTAEPTVELEREPEPEPNAAFGAEEEDCKKSDILEMKSEDDEKKKENSDLDHALLKLKNIGSLVEEELQCSICNELLVAAVTINCAHSFCKHCLGEWKKQRAECPMCRMPITAEHRSVTLDSLISTMVGQLSLELQQRHKEVVEERAALEAAAAAAAEASSGGSQMNNRQGSSSHQDNSNTSQGRGPRHQNYNYNNNHWQPLPPPHHHAHHHHHSFGHAPNAHVPHFPHGHGHVNNAHSHANHPPHAHVHAHVHAPLSQPPYHPPHSMLPHTLPPLGHLHPPHAPPSSRHNSPPPRTSSGQGQAPGHAPGHGQGAGPAGLPPLQAPGQPMGSMGQPHEPLLEHHVRLRRRHGRNLISSGSSSGSSSEEPSDTTSSYSSSGGFSSASERTWFESDYGEYEDEDNEGEPPIVPGIPGRYYGGYGVCFYCNQRGHWSNGCPVRFGF